MMESNEDMPMIVGVGFGEGAVNITYVEKREMTEAAGIQRTMSIDMDHVRNEVAELIEAAIAVLDAGAVLIRNPPKVRPARQALMDLEDDFDRD